MALYITLAVLLFVVVAFLSGKWPFGMIGIMAATILNVTGVMKFSDAFANLANSNVIMVGGMFVLGAALGKTSLIEKIKNWGLKRAGNSSRMILFSFLLTTILLAQFLPPTGIISMMIPFTAALAEDGPLTRSQVIYPISATSFVWQGVINGVAFIGMINGYLSSAKSKAVLGVFDRLLVGTVPAILTLAFMMIIGYKLLPAHPSKEVDESYNEIAAAQSGAGLPKNKENMIYAIFTLTILAMVFYKNLNLDMGTISVIGVLLLMVTGCMDKKEVIGSLNMDVLFMLAGVMTLSTAMDKSGAGKLIADGIIHVLGGHPSAVFIMAVFFFVPAIMTQFMSNTATWVLLVPIAIQTAMRMGYDPRGVALITMFAANAACLTPMAAPSMAIAFGAGGYTLKDYFKVGIPWLLIYGVSIIIFSVLVYPPM